MTLEWANVKIFIFGVNFSLQNDEKVAAHRWIL